jgi:NAD(P)-dependent dehydrogenase (short-subunit alcohol dehydrogenase family)
MKQVIVITGASSGFGALTARALAKAGHIVYASMRDTTGRNASQVEAAAKFAKENNVDLRTTGQSKSASLARSLAVILVL